MPANGPGRGHELLGVEVLPDEADPRVVRIVEGEIGDRVDSGFESPGGNPRRAGGMDDEGRLRPGDQEVTASEAPLGSSSSARRTARSGSSKPSKATPSRPRERTC